MRWLALTALLGIGGAMSLPLVLSGTQRSAMSGCDGEVLPSSGVSTTVTPCLAPEGVPCHSGPRPPLSPPSPPPPCPAEAIDGSLTPTPSLTARTIGRNATPATAPPLA